MAFKSSGAGGVEQYFPQGVWVSVPAQVAGQELTIEGEAPPDPGDLPSIPGVFDASDTRINFQVTDTRGVVKRFRPPLVLRVAITEIARQAAEAANRPLKLALWDGVEWEILTEKKHQFHLTHEFGMAVIRDMGDPAVAWGQ